MPFTPFHMGAGLLTKAAVGSRMSLASFALAQVVMDIEPGVRMVLGDATLHGWSHTWLGAAAIGAITVPLARPLAQRIVIRWNREVRHYGQAWLAVEDRVGWRSIAVGAFWGTLSHVLLDSLMHADMLPGAPFTQANPVLGLVAHDTVYDAMAVSAVVGALVWLLRKYRYRGAVE